MRLLAVMLLTLSACDGIPQRHHRPGDFAIQYAFYGRGAPPYCYDALLTVDPSGVENVTLSLCFSGFASWQNHMGPAELDRLYFELQNTGVFQVKPDKESAPPPIGGGMQKLIITVKGTHYEVPAASANPKTAASIRAAETLLNNSMPSGLVKQLIVEASERGR